MTQAEIEIMIIEVVCAIQRMSGREAVPVRMNTCPLLEVPGFDSLNGVEATIEITEKLGLDLESNNILVDDSGALTISQIAEKLCGCVTAK